MNDIDFRRVVEEVRDRTDLVDLIGSDTTLTSAGSVMKGRSPFNQDEHPSLVVWPQTRTWRDFSGGGEVGGDCFEWLMRRESCGFLQALQELATRASVSLPGQDDADVAAEIERLDARRRVSTLMTAAAAYYHSVLPKKVRQAWFQDRYGFTDETVDSLLLGWADGHLFEHLTGIYGASLEDALETGLFVRRRDGSVVDFFQGRLVFPYWLHGRVVYFIARATEHTGDEPWEQAKYKKLPTHSERHPYISPLVANDTLYNEDAARRADEILITEGVTDCISAMQAGVACVSPVTVRFRKQDHPRLLALTARANRVIVCNDTEGSGAGEAGALETAQALHAAGRDVRIATIPLPDGRDKIDVNEVVATDGPAALTRVLSGAKRYPTFLIEHIPSETPKEDLAARLEPVLSMIRATGPLEREAYTDLIKERFKLRIGTVRKLLGPGPTEKKQKTRGGDGGEVSAGGSRKGEVFEDTDHYYILGRGDEPVMISSFQIEPRQRILVEDGEIVDADVTTDRRTVHRNVRFPREAWQSKRNFLRVLRPVDLQWTGSDENVQGVLRLVASRTVPTRRGTLNLGYLNTRHGPRWITPDGMLRPPDASDEDEDIVYVPSGASLYNRVRYRDDDEADATRELAAAILPNLLRLNTQGVVLPIIGWFFAAPLKVRIAEALGHFPIMVVWGTAGSGKSSLIMEVFWPLLGVVSAEPYSATETEFALLKLLSATNSVPVFIDEYKPYDMPRHRRNTLHRYVRRLYTGEVEERGRADQTLVTYRLGAPLCIAGETRPIEAAIVERILTANPDKDELLRDPSHVDAFEKIRTVNPGRLSASIVRFLLGRDTVADLTTAKEVTERLLAGREIPYRVRDNLIVMVLGLIHFEEYAASMGVELPDLDIEGAVAAVLDDLLEGGGSSVKTGLDYFLEELSVMAVNGSIRHGKQYVYQDGRLALHFPSCHAAYSEHCRRSAFEGEVPDRKALRRQLMENSRRGGYVKEIDQNVCFRGREDRRRAVLIDMEEAKQSLVVDDFPDFDSDDDDDDKDTRYGW